MKVFVKQNGLEKFLFSASSWTNREDDALDFEFPARAEQFCREHQLRDAQILVRPISRLTPRSPAPEQVTNSGPVVDSCALARSAAS